MKYCAVICEYNPFHSGHAYQLDRAVKETAADGVIAVMSGPFVQRAEPAVVDEFLRAECALRNGADMVIELPVAIATAAGRDFARGAVNIVAALPDVKFLVMGCEDETHIATLADVQFTESESFKAVLKSALDAGASYPSAYTTATAVEAEKRGIDRNTSDIILKKPNNLLCIEYIKALKSLGSDIEPVLIKRRGSDYNDKEIGTAMLRLPPYGRYCCPIRTRRRRRCRPTSPRRSHGRRRPPRAPRRIRRARHRRDPPCGHGVLTYFTQRGRRVGIQAERGGRYRCDRRRAVPGGQVQAVHDEPGQADCARMPARHHRGVCTPALPGARRARGIQTLSRAAGRRVLCQPGRHGQPRQRAAGKQSVRAHHRREGNVFYSTRLVTV